MATYTVYPWTGYSGQYLHPANDGQGWRFPNTTLNAPAGERIVSITYYGQLGSNAYGAQQRGRLWISDVNVLTLLTASSAGPNEYGGAGDPGMQLFGTYTLPTAAASVIVGMALEATGLATWQLFGNVARIDYTTAPVAAPSATTSAATNIAARTATLNGVSNGNGDSIQTYFEYGRTTAYGQTTPSTAAPSTLSNRSANLTGLVPGATYHYRLVAHNTNTGVKTYGADMSFRAKPTGAKMVI